MHNGDHVSYWMHLSIDRACTHQKTGSLGPCLFHSWFIDAFKSKMNSLLICLTFLLYIPFIKERLRSKVSLTTFSWPWDHVSYMYRVPFPHFLWTVHPFFSSFLFNCMYMCSSCRVNVISQDMSESKQIAQESRIHMERFVVYISCLSVCLSARLSVYVSFLPVCIFSISMFFVSVRYILYWCIL